MKKYFSGMLAVIIAIGLSSYSSVKKHPGSTAVLYWYEVTYDAGNTNPRILSQTPQQAEKANVVTSCTTGTIDCFRGFDAQLSSFPSTAAGVDQIQKN